MVSLINSLGGVARPAGVNGRMPTPASKEVAGPIAREPTVSISNAAASLSTLYEAANASIQKNSVKPLTGSSSDDPRSYYLNVETYNNHVFDEAANTMVVQAKEIGFDLDKKDVITNLKQSNSVVSSYKTDIVNGQGNLTSDHMSKYLSPSDLNQITDFYIKSKSEGLPDIVTLSYAVNIGMAKHDQALGITSYSGDRYLVTDEEIPPTGIPSAVSEAAKKLYGHFGLSNMAINMLASSYIGPEDKSGQSQAFDFLLKLLDERLARQTLPQIA